MQEKVFFFNHQKEKLSGIIFTPTKKKKLPALIFCHGFSSSKYTKISLAKRIAKKGLAVLIFDAAGCGESSGRFEDHTITKYVDDLGSAVQYMKSQDFVDSERVAIAGHSQGGMIVVIFAAKHKGVKTVIPIDAPYHILKNRGPNTPFASDSLLKKWKKEGFVEFVVRVEDKKVPRKLAYSFVKDCKKYDLLKLIKKVSCPVVIVQGGSDTVVPPEHALELHRNATKPKELIIVKGVNHKYKGKDEKTLEKIIVKSLKKYL